VKKDLLKRPFDIFLSSIGLFFSLPLWLFISLCIKLEDRGPIFYTQERVGKNGRIFKVIKFRSMIKNAEDITGPLQAQKNDPRITKVGKILRATAMDELPQLWNILKGDMSFVGPRALRPQEVEVRGNPKVLKIEDIPGYKERISVRPGLTGLAQVYLPADAPRKDKFRYDLLYIKKQSFLLDLKLIFLSFWITFKGKWESKEKKV
jgi:lipopolysaccharide/colanic/teichoic acid biosynthesis glycosyltransferase